MGHQLAWIQSLLKVFFTERNNKLTEMRSIELFKKFIIGGLLLFLAIGCNQDTVKVKNNSLGKIKKDTDFEGQKEPPSTISTPKGMVWVPGGKFTQGALKNDKMAMEHEKPNHETRVDGFFMDITEVTNAEFKKFIEETGYITVAERKIDWEEMKKQLPPGTPKPEDSILQPGSLIFKKTKKSVPNLYDYSQWWEWKIGANWMHPKGPASNLVGKENYPVVHVAYEDALAYCEWAGRRLPTESEWEWAAKGGLEETRFTWGNDERKMAEYANTWEGEFPTKNTKKDGFENIAPVKSYQANGYGLFDMAGNVWEMTGDWYNSNYYKEVEGKYLINPTGATIPFNQNNPQVQEKVIKGGSFLCNVSYCASFRNSARMANSLDSSQEHLGFRTVATIEMLKNNK